MIRSTDAASEVLTRDHFMERVAEMIHDAQVEGSFPGGTELVTVREPVR